MAGPAPWFSATDSVSGAQQRKHSASGNRLHFIKPVFHGDDSPFERIWRSGPSTRTWTSCVSYEFQNPGELVLCCEHLQTVKYGTARFADEVEKR
jgi:hypothetical protein